MARRPSIGIDFWVMSILLLPFSAFILLVDGALIHLLVQEGLALTYPTVTGSVEHASLAVHPGSKRDSYDLQVRYTYRVDGQRHTATRYSYGGGPFDKHQIERIVTELNSAGKVAVRYNPRDPADAVLAVGCSGPGVVFFLHLLVIFNCLMVGGWTVLVRGVWCTIAQPVAGWPRVTEHGGRTWIDLWPERNVVAPVAVLGIYALLSMLVMLPFGFTPPWVVVGPVWGLGAASMMYAVMPRSRAATRARQLLMIDRESQTLQLPAPAPKWFEKTMPPPPIPFAAVTGISIEEVYKGKVGMFGGSDSWAYVPTFHIRHSDGNCESHGLLEWQSKGLAEWLADWLRERVVTVNP